MRYLHARLALAGVVASLPPLAAKMWWVFELTSHFRVQLLAGLAVVALFCAWRRAWTWCGALVLCMAVNVPPLIPYLKTVPTGTPRPATLTVLAANVEADNDEHAELFTAIEREDPDVVLVVEFTEQWSERFAVIAAEYPHQFLRPSFDAFGMAVYSRHPFDSIVELELAPTRAIDARLRTTHGTVRFIGVHLLPPVSAEWSRQRNSQLELLGEHVASTDESLVVLGDFNISPYSPYFADWLASTGLKDAGFGRGPRFTWPTSFPLLGVPIDHCIISDELGVAEYRRLARFGSDHYPVLARLIQE